MLRSRILWKLYSSVLVIILVTALLVGLFVSRQIEENSLEEIRGLLKTRSDIVAVIASPDILDLSPEARAELDREMRALGRDGVRITLAGADGAIILDTSYEVGAIGSIDTRPEIVEARTSGEGMSIRMDRAGINRVMYYARRIQEGDEIAGYIRSSMPMVEIRRRIDELRVQVTVGTLIAAVAALLPGFLFARRIITPLIRMTSAAEKIAAGNFRGRLWRGGSDEISKLAKAFDAMSAQLANRMDMISSDRNKLLAILGSMVEGVIAVDSHERIVHINLAAAEILDVMPSESVGKRIWEVSRITEIIEAVASTLSTGSRRQLEARLIDRPSDRVIEMHTSPLRNAAGQISGAVIVLFDATELRKLATMRQDFITNVSHELKTPITAIRGIVETLLEDEEMPPERQRSFIEKLETQSLRLNKLIESLVTLSRAESEELELNMVPLAVQDPVKQAYESMRPTAERKRLRHTLEMPDEPLTVRGDEEALRRALDNLIDNAIKFTDPGGSVSVRVFSLGGDAIIEVSDSGIGMEPRELDRIFERFYRVDKARSRQSGGYGIGLSIVKRTAIAFGGEVTVASLPGKGSTFRIRLPLTADQA